MILQLLHSDSLIYSFGVGQDVSFDLELIEKTGCSVHGFDPTPKSIEWMSRQPLPENFIFHTYGLADTDGLMSFSPPPNPDWASYREDPAGSCVFPVKKLSTIKRELGHAGVIDFLKLDIEGSEYSVLDDILSNGLNPIQMSVEFHGQADSIRAWIKNNTALNIAYDVLALPSNEFFFLLKSARESSSLSFKGNPCSRMVHPTNDLPLKVNIAQVCRSNVAPTGIADIRTFAQPAAANETVDRASAGEAKKGGEFLRFLG